MPNKIDKFTRKPDMDSSASLPENFFCSDRQFDSLYTLRAQQLSAIHWTPVAVARQAAAHLCNGPGKNIMDIGSGTGKFCLVGAYYFPEYEFYGIEQRKALVDEAVITQKATQLQNVHFLHGNFTGTDMQPYDHFYFYNSFSENLYHYKPIDNLVSSSAAIYEEYLQRFYTLLEEKPAGTRLATYYCPDDAIPAAYRKIRSAADRHLQLWISV